MGHAPSASGPWQGAASYFLKVPVKPWSQLTSYMVTKQEEKKEEEKPAATATATSEPMETEDGAAPGAAAPDGPAQLDPMQS